MQSMALTYDVIHCLPTIHIFFLFSEITAITRLDLIIRQL
jgi:hypothetical protein